jgi:hypothetical protein
LRRLCVGLRIESTVDPQHGRLAGDEDDVRSTAASSDLQQRVQRALLFGSRPALLRGGAVELVDQLGKLGLVGSHSGFDAGRRERLQWGSPLLVWTIRRR